MLGKLLSAGAGDEPPGASVWRPFAQLRPVGYLGGSFWAKRPRWVPGQGVGQTNTQGHSIRRLFFFGPLRGRAGLMKLRGRGLRASSACPPDTTIVTLSPFGAKLGWLACTGE